LDLLDLIAGLDKVEEEIWQSVIFELILIIVRQFNNGSTFDFTALERVQSVSLKIRPAAFINTIGSWKLFGSVKISSHVVS
jgi:hypothetical protein